MPPAPGSDPGRREGDRRPDSCCSNAGRADSWLPGTAGMAPGSESGGGGALGSRSGYLSPLRTEVLSGSSSFSDPISFMSRTPQMENLGNPEGVGGGGSRSCLPPLRPPSLSPLEPECQPHLGPLARPRGPGHLGPSHNPASVSPSGWARGLQAACPGGPQVWLGSFLCSWAGVGRRALPSERALRSLAGGVGRLSRLRCPVSGWHRTVGGAAPQEMSAVRVAVAFGPLGGCALQGRRV